MKIFTAPLQGHTHAAWRHFHALEYIGSPSYITPFIRLEKGEARRHDLRDYTSPLNDRTNTEPQIIFKDEDEFRTLVESLSSLGANRINLNMGCPFPMQTGRGRGAGLLARPDTLERIADIRSDYPDISFSVKMRLGMTDPHEWQETLAPIARLNPQYIAVHPRTARQQYSGELHMEQFGRLLAEAPAPIIFNGDIKTPEGIGEILSDYNRLEGVMIGRGLLGRPSLIEEFMTGKTLPVEIRLSRMRRLHDRILQYYSDTLCGETQILTKIKEFWEYAEPEIGHRTAKSIRKCSTLAKYISALSAFG